MKRYDPRLWIGGLLVFLGLLSLLDNLNIISGVSNIFWGVVWGLVGLYFFYRLYMDRSQWWAIFPAFTLLGLAASPFSGAFSGSVFLGAISLAFWWVYFSDTNRWWAIIPGGVMLTLGVISVLDNFTGLENGGILFLGLGLTFILVAILPGGSSRSWAFIPGIILLIFGAFLSTSFGGLTAYLWPVVLIILGGYFIVRFFMKPTS